MDAMVLGAKILETLDYIPDGIDKFRDGVVMYSEEPNGILWDLTPEMQNVVAELQAKALTVYAVIHGRYAMSADDIMTATSYLYVHNGIVSRAEDNLSAGLGVLDGIVELLDSDYGFCLPAFVTGYYDEFGDIGVKGRLGGLTRTC